MKIFAPLIILVLITNHVAAQQKDKLAEEIVDKNIAAVGGIAAFDSLQSVVRTSIIRGAKIFMIYLFRFI